MTRRLVVACSLCRWTITGLSVTSAMESSIRRHMETEHADRLPEPGFGGRPRLADVLRFFRMTGHSGQTRARRA